MVHCGVLSVVCELCFVWKEVFCNHLGWYALQNVVSTVRRPQRDLEKLLVFQLQVFFVIGS